MSWWGTLIRESTWGFAIASVFLLSGITLLLGGVFLMSLRLLGLMMNDYPVSEWLEISEGGLTRGLSWR